MSRFICSPALKDDAKDCEGETCEDADADGGGAEEENGPKVIGEHFWFVVWADGGDWRDTFVWTLLVYRRSGIDAMGIIYCTCLYDCIPKDYEVHVSQSLQQL